jgi:hypothetical protein
MTRTVTRYDRGVAALLPAETTPEGYLLVEGIVARPGVYVYRRPDGSTHRELIPLTTLADAASASTLARKPVTLAHPDAPVTPNTVGVVGVGDVGEEVTVLDTGHVRVRFAVRRADAIAAVRSGVVELSPGYDVEIEVAPGVDPTWGPYDAIQRRRSYNHLAIVDAARGGAVCRLRIDSEDALMENEAPTETITPAVVAEVAPAATDPRADAIAKLDAAGVFASLDSWIEDANTARALSAKFGGVRGDALIKAIGEPPVRVDAATVPDPLAALAFVGRTDAKPAPVRTPDPWIANCGPQR